jgi:hypothetical protein
MKRAFAAAWAGLCIGCLAACVETTYGAENLYEMPIRGVAMIDPRIDAVSDPASDALTHDPGGWRWVDGAWRWVPQFVAPQAPVVAPTIATAPKSVAVRVQISVRATMRDAVGATVDVSANTPSATIQPVSARFAITSSGGIRIGDTNANGAEGSQNDHVGAAASRESVTLEPGAVSMPIPTVVASVPSDAMPMSVGTSAAFGAEPTSAAFVPGTTTPEEIASAPAAGEISSANSGGDVAIRVRPMRTSGSRWRAFGLRGF